MKDEIAKLVLIADTTCAGLGKTSWEGIYNLLIVEEEGAMARSTDKSKNTLCDLDNSFLHRIAASAKVLPYNDMVRWVIESINITNGAFYIAYGGMFRTFSAEDIKKMYNFQTPRNITIKHFYKFSPRRTIHNWTLSGNGDIF